MLELLLGLILVAILVLVFSDQCIPSRISRLTLLIPGKKRIPIIGSFGLPGNGKAQLLFWTNLINTYGPVSKYWVGQIPKFFLVDPNDAEAILGSMSSIEKGLTYDFLKPWLGTGLLTSSGAKWQSRRKAITPTFHFKILEEFIDSFNKKGQKLLRIMREKANGEVIDVMPYIGNYTLDVICETAMGIEVGAQDNSKSPYISAVKGMLDYVMNVKDKSWFERSINLLLKKNTEKENMLKVLHNFTNSVIKTKKSEWEKSNDSTTYWDSDVKKKTAFLELLLNLSENPESSIKSDEDIREEVDTFMFEGHDTTSSGLSSTLVLLAKHAGVQDKVFEEVREVIPNSDYELTYKDLQSLKYTEMVVKESIRLYPPVPSISRTLSKDTQLPSGYILPAGSVVTIGIYHIHRNTKYFPQPDKFHPDRFLPQNIVGRHAFAFIPFSAGPRNCIGQKFAMLEMKSTIAKLIYNFKLDYAGPGTEIDPSTGLIFKSSSGNKLRLSLRK